MLRQAVSLWQLAALRHALFVFDSSQTNGLGHFRTTSLLCILGPLVSHSFNDSEKIYRSSPGFGSVRFKTTLHLSIPKKEQKQDHRRNRQERIRTDALLALNLENTLPASWDSTFGFDFWANVKQHSVCVSEQMGRKVQFETQPA